MILKKDNIYKENIESLQVFLANNPIVLSNAIITNIFIDHDNDLCLEYFNNDEDNIELYYTKYIELCDREETTSALDEILGHIEI